MACCKMAMKTIGFNQQHISYKCSKTLSLLASPQTGVAIRFLFAQVDYTGTLWDADCRVASLLAMTVQDRTLA